MSKLKQIAEEEAKKMVETSCVFRWMEVFFSRVIPDPSWPPGTFNDLRVNVTSPRATCSACHPPQDVDDSFGKICARHLSSAKVNSKPKRDHC